MASTEGIESIFNDRILVDKIKKKLPFFFQLGEEENSRNGKIGMEIGSARERILISLFIYKYGEKNVFTDIPITKSEVDTIVNGLGVSIKTITGQKIVGIKLNWTVDWEKVLNFTHSYVPSCQMLLAHINWNSIGGLYLFSVDSQKEVLHALGKEKYFKIPKKGTNPRGVELSVDALNSLLQHPKSKKISINWERQEIDYNPYSRWLELWNQ